MPDRFQTRTTPHPRPAGPEPAAHLSRTLLWIGAVTAILLGLLWQSYPAEALPRTQLADIPLRGPGFRGWEVALTPTERLVLGRVDLVNRRYWMGTRRLFVSVVDGSKDRHAVHDPRYCFQGAGWNLASEQRLALPGGDGVRLQLARGADRFEVLYWFTDGTSRYASFPRYWWQTTLRRLTLGRLGTEPLLVVVQDLDADGNRGALAPEQLIGALRL